MALDIRSRIKNASKNLNKPEEMLGKGLMQPFNSMTSSSRKVMFGPQIEQILPLVNAEPPLIQTGYEDEFGRYSSSFVVSDDNYQVVAKIPKYRHIPNHHYILVLKSLTRNYYTVIERTIGIHNTETFGYLMDNNNIDQYEPSHTIYRNTTLKRSRSFSEDNNRQDGVNLLTAYTTVFPTMEDGIVLSESGAEKLRAPLFKKVEVIINDNDIILNLYGERGQYKSFPDIGEHIKDGLLCAVRRETKDESLYSLSWDRLTDIMVSDEKFTLNGQVVDINVYCNNPEKLAESNYNAQIKRYYDESIRYSNDIVAHLEYIATNSGIKSSYELKKMYHHHKMVVDGHKWINRKPFSNIILEFMVLEIDDIELGDKLSDRYGGKGVIAEIRPDELMPQTQYGERVEIMFNALGPVRRENPGQLIEVSLNFINDAIIKQGYSHHKADDTINLVLDYLDIVVPKQGKYMRDVLSNVTNEDHKNMFVHSLSEGLMLSIEPLSETIDMMKLAQIYDKFNFIQPAKVKVPIVGSDGETRYVDSRRTMICGKKYIYRLKQYAEEKASATSLSGTNLNSEPVKSKSSSQFKEPLSKTPIGFGYMETGNMLHFLNIYPVVENLMIHSTSPKGRRLAEQLLTGDPFNINIELSYEETNRRVEVLNAYLKTMGLELVFEKRIKELINPAIIVPVKYVDQNNHLINPVYIDTELINPIEYVTIGKNRDDGLITPAVISPVEFIPIIRPIKK